MKATHTDSDCIQIDISVFTSDDDCILLERFFCFQISKDDCILVHKYVFASDGDCTLVDRSLFIRNDDWISVHEFVVLPVM